MTLKTYSGEILKVLGTLLVKIKYNKQVVHGYVYVVLGDGPPLLGRDILSKIRLNWSTIYRMQSTELPDHDKIPHGFVTNLKKQYHELFSEKIWKL